MSLSLNQALKAAKNPPNQTEVKRGKDYQSELRILTEAYSRDTIQHQHAWLQLKTYLSNILSTEKYNAIIKYFLFPLDIVNISNDIMTDIYTVFSGRNAAFDVQYPNDRFKEIAEQVLSELNLRQWIEEKGKKVLKSAPNAVTVVDLDKMGNPILVLVPNEKLMGYEFNTDGSFEYIVFCHSEGKDENGNAWKKIGVYDSEYYRVVLEQSGNYSMLVENPHNLGYCPAKFFYDKPKINKREFNRSVPLTNAMGAMVKWQLFELFTYFADHYGTFPIVEYALSQCDDEKCEDGIIAPQPNLGTDNEILSWTQPKACPTCAKNNLIGPGTAVGVEVSEDADVQDTRGVLNFVSVDINGLEFLKTKQEDREGFIKTNTVGYNNTMTKEAVNEQQVRALVESRRKPLLEVKEHLNELYKWIVKTTFKLLYEVDVNVSADFGTEFFIMTEKDILLLIQEAKKSGVQSSEIAELNHLLIATKYKNNPYKAQYMRIAADLEPSPFDTREEVEKKAAAGMISREDYYIKLNFTDLIGKFERENGSIVAFGAELPYEEKINRIKNTLIFYTQQTIGNEQQIEDDSDEQIQDSGSGTSDI